MRIPRQRIDAFVDGLDSDIEQLDEHMIHEQVSEGAYNTETVGSIIDRISVLALKVYHWHELLRQGKVKFQVKFLVAADQFKFLTSQLGYLLVDMRLGKRQMRLFRQLKMYNDPELNPRMNVNGRDQAGQA